ncbi:uncharacterized protein LOC116264611 [Nymphaea colorata]|nr:uncharacterized protein LOC116264611 [Nymphaea colorata]
MLTGGQNLVFRCPAFSGDGKKLLLCTGNIVSIYSTTTSLLISELEGHTAPVTSVVVVPAAGAAGKLLYNCWTSSLDGTLRYWNFASGELIKTVDVNIPIYFMVVPMISILSDNGNKFSSLYAFISVEHAAPISNGSGQQKARKGQVRVVNLTKSRVIEGILTESSEVEPLVGSSSGDFFGTCSVNKLLIWKFPTKDFSPCEVRKIKLHHTKQLTVLAFHPNERIVAGGDITGRILIWRGFGKRTFSQNGSYRNKRVANVEEEEPGVRDNDDADSCSTWHWHPTEVKILSFSSDGAYLFSGGKEGVLVCWQLDTEKKNFLPRIGSQLLYFVESPVAGLSSVSCADNQIHLLKMPSMESLKPITGIKPSYPIPEVYKGPWGNKFVVSSAAGILALLTESYHVQFYHLFHNRELSEVQVCERNYQPGDDVMVVLPLLSVSSDASIMGTVEVRLPEEKIGGLVCLKFWEHRPQKEEYALSTVIYEPHGDAGISALAFHPSCSMAVSTSYGGNFKVWIRSSQVDSDKTSQKYGWKCQSIGSYKKKPMTAAGFSEDGSVLAVAAETSITLWDAGTNTLIAVVGETLKPAVALHFVPKTHNLVAICHGSKPQLSVWNLEKLSLAWSYQLVIEAVACNADNSQFAALVLVPSVSQNTATVETSSGWDGLILLFNTEDPIPISMWSVRKARGGGLSFVVSRTFAGESSKTNCASLLTYINGDHEYLVFNPYSKEDQITAKHAQQFAVQEEKGENGYESIYGKLPPVDSEKPRLDSVPFMPSDKPWERLFDGPSHILPPLPKLCPKFLASLLQRRTDLQCR